MADPYLPTNPNHPIELHANAKACQRCGKLAFELLPLDPEGRSICEPCYIELGRPAMVAPDNPVALKADHWHFERSAKAHLHAHEDD